MLSLRTSITISISTILLIAVLAYTLYPSSNIVEPIRTQGPFPTLTSCAIPIYNIHSEIMNSTGFSVSNISGITDYKIKPGQQGTISFKIYVSNYPNVNSNVVFDFPVNNSDWTQLYYSKTSQSVNSIITYPDPNANPKINSSYGINISYKPVNEILTKNSSNSFETFIDVSSNAPLGTYWMSLSPGICLGGTISLLTIGQNPSVISAKENPVMPP